MSKIAALQMPTLSMSEARVDYYLKAIKENGANLTLFAEYELNSFFTELKEMPRSLVIEQIHHKKELMASLAKKHDMTIVAPIILENGDGFVKTCAKFTPNSAKFYEQNILINYDHWDEAEFFANKKKRFEVPIFTHERLKFAILFGFETHFDELWLQIAKKGVDCVLVPSACTFDSAERWAKLLEIRAFLNSVYILRANRIGKAKFSQMSDFYGDSFLVHPEGIIINRLKNEEGSLIAGIEKDEITKCRKKWKFR